MELLVHISNEVDPADLASWVCVAKQIYASASKALSVHQVRFADYGRLSNRPSNRKGKARKVNLIDMFKEILSNREVAFYIRNLSLKDFKEGWNDPRYPRRRLDEGEHSIVRFLTLSPLCVRDLAAREGCQPNLLWANRGEWEEFHADFLNGSEEVIAGLFISQLTHLSRLEILMDSLIPRGSVASSNLFAVFEKMMTNQVVSEASGFYGSRHINTRPFSRLTTIVLKQYELGWNEIGRMIELFMAVPSIQRISATQPGTWYRDPAYPAKKDSGE